MYQSSGFSVQRHAWNASHWVSVGRRNRIHQVAAVPDRTHVGTRLDIGRTGCGVGFLKEVSARVRGTPMRHCMCHTASVYVGYISVKKIQDMQSSSFIDKLYRVRTTVPPEGEKGYYSRSRGWKTVLRGRDVAMVEYTSDNEASYVHY